MECSAGEQWCLLEARIRVEVGVRNTKQVTMMTEAI